MIDLDGIQIVIDHASPGPWEQSISAPDAVIAPNRKHSVGSDMARYYGGPVVGDSMSAADRMFLVVARQRMPALVAELRAAREVVKADRNAEHERCHRVAYVSSTNLDPFCAQCVALAAYDKVTGEVR